MSDYNSFMKTENIEVGTGTYSGMVKFMRSFPFALTDAEVESLCNEGYFIRDGKRYD